MRSSLRVCQCPAPKPAARQDAPGPVATPGTDPRLVPAQMRDGVYKPGRRADAGSGEPGRSADAHDRHRCQVRTVGSAPRVRDRAHLPPGQGELTGRLGIGADARWGELGLGIGADARWGELSLHTRGSLRKRAAAARQDSDGPCYGARTHGQGRRQSELRRAASLAAARGTPGGYRLDPDARSFSI